LWWFNLRLHVGGLSSKWLGPCGARFGLDSSSQRGKRVKMLGIRKARPRPQRVARTSLGLSAAALCLLALLGCATEDRPGNDPLLTGATRRGASPATPVSSPAPATPAPAGTSAVPPLPAPQGPTSTAALATGSTAALDANHDLRIPGRENSPGSPSNGNASWEAQGTPASAAAHAPEATPVARADVPPPGSGVVLAGGVRVGSYEQAQAVLAARGVTWQRLETWGEEGEWKFSCSIPNRQNAHIR